MTVVNTVSMTSKLCLPPAAVVVVSPLDLVSSHTYFCVLLPSGEFIIGRVIRAMSQCWHPNCFKCVICHIHLADVGFVKNQGR